MNKEPSFPHENMFLVWIALKAIGDLGKTLEPTHGHRYGYFSSQPPNYENCVYAKKTRLLFEQLEKEDTKKKLLELRDKIDKALLALENHGQ